MIMSVIAGRQRSPPQIRFSLEGCPHALLIPILALPFHQHSNSREDRTHGEPGSEWGENQACLQGINASGSTQQRTPSAFLPPLVRGNTQNRCRSGGRFTHEITKTLSGAHNGVCLVVSPHLWDLFTQTEPHVLTATLMPSVLSPVNRP